ncbi:MAG: hypothetical protein ACI4WM_04855 [Erysipelotrichaceae bacterium]
MENKIILEKQDLTNLSWSRIRSSSGTAGTFLKATKKIDGKKIYYKLSNFSDFEGVIGHECVNEIIIDRLLNVLGVEHLSYSLIHADIKIDGNIYDTYISASEDFKKENETKIALDKFYRLEKNDKENPLEFCIRMGFSPYIYEMMAVDFIICNRDRHGANIEVLRNSKDRTIRLGPLFDHGKSLFFSCIDDEAIEQFDVMADKTVQCFTGTRSLYKNLELIPKGALRVFNPLTLSDKDYIMANLDNIITKKHQDKAFKMIYERYRYYEDFCNQRRI